VLMQIGGLSDHESVAAWVLAVAAAAALAAADKGNLEQGRALALTSARQQPSYRRDYL
jgi:hypothetical protein